MKILQIDMPDGTQWTVPSVQVARHYAERCALREGAPGTQKHRVGYAESLRCIRDDAGHLALWAKNGMTWADISPYAMQLSRPFSDYDAMWPAATVTVEDTDTDTEDKP